MILINYHRTNACSTKKCEYDHAVTIDTYGRSLFSATEPNTLPPINNMQSLKSATTVSRKFDLETPGTGTLLGPRNDNDWRDIAKINVMPTMDELVPGRRTVYMPHKDKMFPLPRVLDVAFRHFREASLGPVRDCTADAMGRMMRGEKFPGTTVEVAGDSYNAYQNARVERFYGTEGRFAATTFTVAFASPGNEFMARESVLRGGHLLALLTMDDNVVHVVWLKATGGWSDRDSRGRISQIGMLLLHRIHSCPCY